MGYAVALETVGDQSCCAGWRPRWRWAEFFAVDTHRRIAQLYAGFGHAQARLHLESAGAGSSEGTKGMMAPR
jgi:hypothetical protein